MKRLTMSLWTASLLLAAWGCSSPEPLQGAPPEARGLRLERVITRLSEPVHLAAPPGDDRLFVVEQAGRILIFANGRLLEQPFLDIRDRVSSGGERGLLSVAFHPRYRENGRFYVNFTDDNGDTRVERFEVSADSNRADATTASLVIRIEQPYSNHNGGHIVFGPDGMLWIGMGDGGSGGDPKNHGQNRRSLLGKMLRLDVDRATPYAIPRDNPFARGGGRPEIWSLGLRNPWRFCFDAVENLVYIADVGQNRWEEVNVASSKAAGLDYGWKKLEGLRCYEGGCNPAGTLLPAVVYPHKEGCSVTGGEVYRGTRLPSLVGHYFYADYCNGWIRSFRYADGRATDQRQWRLEEVPVSSFGVDGAGELYVVAHDGNVYRLEPERK